MPTALIIGAGPNIGKASAETFSAAGYHVAVASRTQKLDAKFRYYAFDASKPETVPTLFEKVTADLGSPSVVIYISAAGHVSPPENPFDFELDEFRNSADVNMTSPYYAAREAVRGFEKLGPSGLGPEGGLISVRWKRFYYLDEKHADGTYVTSDISGTGHAEEFLKLAKDSKQGPWNYTFVSGKGYTQFPHVESAPWKP
ncbi:hypothetical protein Daesc_007226 [Daldinia eschscholtzii]|uniref:Uncharacterized protein n=1 Tax=Daldinia eschscholtzii TaxID=292717 RepID=A0AAX6MET5_9PEZI